MRRLSCSCFASRHSLRAIRTRQTPSVAANRTQRWNQTAATSSNKVDLSISSTATLVKAQTTLGAKPPNRVSSAQNTKTAKSILQRQNSSFPRVCTTPPPQAVSQCMAIGFITPPSIPIKIRAERRQPSTPTLCAPKPTVL